MRVRVDSPTGLKIQLMMSGVDSNDTVAPGSSINQIEFAGA